MRQLRVTIREDAQDTVPLAGTVAAEPIGPDAVLDVTLDAYGHRMQHEAFGWAPRGDALPSAGDRVWVVRADDGEFVVVAWHPGALDLED
jgi:hypothetical protein